MKILIIQLARLGDIYMTWPALRGLRRIHPDAEIHLLTRPRFEGAVAGLDAIDKHWSLPVSQILAPLVQDEADIDSSMHRLSAAVTELRDEQYDWIINLTFSPASSFLTHALSSEKTRVHGYSRYDDGTLRLCDDVSAYFYAQVGTAKPNRVHVADIFASMLEMQYLESDWSAPEMTSFATALPERYIVLHVGASENHKAMTTGAWIAMLQEVSKVHSNLPVVLIGADHETLIAREVIASVPQMTFIDLVGKTKISDLFSILQESEMLVGCDSAPIHMASLTDTPTFNISLGQVNFWETGPKASLSFIYRVGNHKDLLPEKAGVALSKLLEGQVSPELIIRAAGLVSYDIIETAHGRFQWDMVQALYLGGAYPIADRMEIIEGAIQLLDVNSFAMEQICLIPEKGLEFIGPLLNRAEEIIESISQMVPELSPLINWYQAEKVRIGPGTLGDICAAALNVHERLASHLHAYVPQESFLDDEEVFDGAL